MFSFISSIWEAQPQKFEKHFVICDVPKIHIGLYDRSVKSMGIQICDDINIYKCKDYKKMDNGLLYLFEEDIRLRISCNQNEYINIHIFSIKHNIGYDIILTSTQIDSWKYFQFANRNNNVNYCDFDNIFDFIEEKSHKKDKNIDNKVPFINVKEEYDDKNKKTPNLLDL